ncbi:MAG: protein-tyrosine-phosphatase [Bacteroidota bacterium]|nr:protein-tyrosine-phosphatase [Bacteroidota bacterium]
MLKSATDVSIYEPVRAYIHKIQQEHIKITEERKQRLDKVIAFIQAKLDNNEPAHLMFVCTHNSRRSHLSQIWAQTLAAYYGLDGVRAYSAGTEVTAFNERAVRALQRAGFAIRKLSEQTNPIYTVQYAHNALPIHVFSKLVSDTTNPSKGFCAIMNCSQAEQACPVVPGAVMRVSLPYDDPKEFDGMPQEEKQYDECCRQIARELIYVFSQVRSPKERK